MRNISRCVSASLSDVHIIPSIAYTLNLSYVSCRRQLRTLSPLTVLVKYATIEHINAARILYDSMRKRENDDLAYQVIRWNFLTGRISGTIARQEARSCALSVATKPYLYAW